MAVATAPATAWTVLLPFFNERDYLAATIASLAAQTVAFRLVLIDNGSTDGSAAVAEAAALAHGLDHVVLIERAPGKVAALKAGLALVTTRWTATCDADTLYPPTYLAAAGRLLARPGCVVAGAYFIAPDAGEIARAVEATAITLAGRLLPRQCHAGGAGQAFCTATLRGVGGFDPALWNYVLEDHEVINRTMTRGTMLYSRAFWCRPSARERDRESIRWTAVERLVYALAAPGAGDWFFRDFLAPRLHRRKLASHRIRERSFQGDEGLGFATPHPVL
ncbi:glycosyl transferase family 2 [Sphingomonas sp. Leaf33]|uniref:glycosyltransferase family 2 protein n=1 Tax=Sphingomonas sp. Leaf33 TaxID=1736215 RepID=UPI0006FF06B2|nr:glycosyltransferase family A protein [Sphingomonas sp. Leaf33]KQN19620.1 glycosyl transferase family 2 [Sphingomonas sp. Leaf33]